MTFGQLKAAIIRDLNRDDTDIVSIVDDFVRERIRYYQREFFFGSPQSDLVMTVVGQTIYAIPENIVFPQLIRMLYYDNWQLLSKVAYMDILALDTNSPSVASPPDLWAPFGEKFRIYPSPDGAYALELSGAGKVPIPPDDTRSNFWTNEANVLLRYATAAQIRAIRFRDYEGAKADMVSTERERLNLLGETVDRESLGVFALNW